MDTSDLYLVRTEIENTSDDIAYKRVHNWIITSSDLEILKK